MKRRDFFKTVTGFVAGVCAFFVPKSKKSIADEEYFWIETKTVQPSSSSLSNTISGEIPWKSLGCVDCYRECHHFDKCKTILVKRVARMAHPLYFTDKNGSVSLLID